MVPNIDKNNGKFAILVSDDGRILNRIALVNPQTSKVISHNFEWKVTPESARVTRSEEEKIAIDKGYENYEIIYNGTDGKSIFFTYREYSPEGMARTAFYQNLTYEVNASLIKFKKIKIMVDTANSEEITYSVVED